MKTDYLATLQIESFTENEDGSADVVFTASDYDMGFLAGFAAAEGFDSVESFLLEAIRETVESKKDAKIDNDDGTSSKRENHKS